MRVMQRPGRAAVASHWYTHKSQRSVTSGKEHVRIRTLEKGGQGQQAKCFTQLRPIVMYQFIGNPSKLKRKVSSIKVKEILKT